MFSHAHFRERGSTTPIRVAPPTPSAVNKTTFIKSLDSVLIRDSYAFRTRVHHRNDHCYRARDHDGRNAHSDYN